MRLMRIALLAASVAVPAHAIEVRSTCPPGNADTYYFPAEVLNEAGYRPWYSDQLRAMREPSLSCGALKGEFSFRFLWLRSFHHPVAIRATYAGDVATLAWVELDGAGGYAPGKPAHRGSRVLSAEEAAGLKSAIDQAGFWQAEGQPLPLGLDGAEWVFEGRGERGYHISRFWSPSHGPFRGLGELLISYSGLNIPKNDIY